MASSHLVQSESTMPSSRSSTGVAVGVGVAVGLALPLLVQKIQSIFSSSNTNEIKKESTHIVRAQNNSSSTAIRITRDKLDEFISDILMNAAGCTQNSARLVANVLSYADARGIPSHGANRVDAYVNEIQAGLVHATASPVVEKCSGSCAVINGNNGLGAVVSKLGMETAIQLAKQHGIAIVTCHSSNHFGAAGYWAQMALDQGYIGMSFTNTSPIAVPTRSRVRGLGTNPFCFFAPAASENDSFQLDMATTTVPIGKIEVMDRINKAVPIGWGVDRNGNDCTDPAEICKFGGLYPLGGSEETAGYKGYGLGMFVEILCAVCSDAAVGPDVLPWTVTRDGPLNYGHCFICIDPSRFAPNFEGRLSELLTRMRDLPGDNVLVAGDPEKEFELDAKENGILLHGPVAAKLKALAMLHNVIVPHELEDLDETNTKSSLYE